MSRLNPVKLLREGAFIGAWQGNHVDLGDCCQREAMFALGHYLTGFHSRTYFISKILPSLEHPKLRGFYRRSPHKDWTGDWDRQSRDQSIPLVAALGGLGLYKHLLFHLLMHILRLGFFTNIRRNGTTKENHGNTYANGTRTRNYNVKLPDIAGPSFWALYLRGFAPLGILAYPLLCLLDLELLFGSLAWRFRRGNDVLNYLVLTRYAKKRLLTPTSWLALKLEDKSLLRKKFRAYFDSTEFQPLYELWENLI